MTEHSDGSTAQYYELPEWACELQDLIRYKGMNGAQAEMFRALYRGDDAEHSDEQRQAKKLLAYATDEVIRTHFPERSFKYHRDAVFAAIFEPEALTQGSDWVTWSGGTSAPSNLGPDQHVQIKRRNGETATGIKYSFDWRWHAGPENLEIVAYRKVLEVPTQGPDWIPWSGGASMPIDVKPGRLLEIIRRDGSVSSGHKTYFNWQWYGVSTDIVAYRLTNNTET